MYTLKAIYLIIQRTNFYFPERSFLLDFGFNPVAFLSSGVISLIFPLSSFNPVSGFGIGITPYMIPPIPPTVYVTVAAFVSAMALALIVCVHTVTCSITPDALKVNLDDLPKFHRLNYS